MRALLRETPLWVMAALCAVLALGLTGCQQEEEVEEGPVVVTPVAPPPQPGAPVTPPGETNINIIEQTTQTAPGPPVIIPGEPVQPGMMTTETEVTTKTQVTPPGEAP